MDILAVALLVVAVIGITLSVIGLLRRSPRGAQALQWVALLLMVVGIVGFWIVFWVRFSG